MASRYTTVPMQKVCRAQLAQSHAAHMDWIHRYAQAWGGICHEAVYNGTRGYKFPLECAKGHRFAFSYHRLSKGAWCMECLKSEMKLNIELMQQEAAKRKGVCLSTEYRNNSQNLLWRCEHGHEWRASASTIRSNHWCPYCAVQNRNKYTIETFKEIARNHGGICHSEEYRWQTKLKLSCAKQHTFEMDTQSLIDGHWCVKCYHDRMRHHSLADLQAFAQKRGGKCLSSEYRNSKTPVEWQCVAGHVWSRAWSNILRIKHEWCTTCREIDSAMRRQQPRKRRAVGIPKKI